MRVVTRRTGLSPELLRVWERRYGVVTPARTHTGRRLYSDAEVERLHLLYKATLGGRSIGLIAALTTTALAELVRQDAAAERTRVAHGDAKPSRQLEQAEQFVEDSMAAITQLDSNLLTTVLRRGSIALPSTAFLETVVSRLLERVGSEWREGSRPPVSGHVAAIGVRRVLEEMIITAPPSAPAILFATLGGEGHELGALIAAVAAAAEGWSVTWLGTGLPAEDIAEAAARLRVRAVGVSLVQPAGDIVASQELRRLRAALPRSIALLVGGPAAPRYREGLDAVAAVYVQDLAALTDHLRLLASKRLPASSGSGNRSRKTPTARHRRTQ